MHHPKIVQSKIVNNCLGVKIDGPTEPQMVPILLFHVSVIEPHKNIVNKKIYGGPKETINEDDNVIISDSTLCSIFLPQFKKMHQYTRLCVVANAAYLPKLYICH